MWFRYFITFLDIVMCLILISFTESLTWEKNKASIIGFGTMILAYAGSAFLMWN